MGNLRAPPNALRLNLEIFWHLKVTMKRVDKLCATSNKSSGLHASQSLITSVNRRRHGIHLSMSDDKLYNLFVVFWQEYTSNIEVEVSCRGPDEKTSRAFGITSCLSTGIVEVYRWYLIAHTGRRQRNLSPETTHLCYITWKGAVNNFLV